MPTVAPRLLLMPRCCPPAISPERPGEPSPRQVWPPQVKPAHLEQGPAPALTPGSVHPRRPRQPLLGAGRCGHSGGGGGDGGRELPRNPATRRGRCGPTPPKTPWAVGARGKFHLSLGFCFRVSERQVGAAHQRPPRTSQQPPAALAGPGRPSRVAGVSGWGGAPRCPLPGAPHPRVHVTHRDVPRSESAFVGRGGGSVAPGTRPIGGHPPAHPCSEAVRGRQARASAEKQV